jgi:hypothetical protein
MADSEIDNAEAAEFITEVAFSLFGTAIGYGDALLRDYTGSGATLASISTLNFFSTIMKGR